MKLFGTNGIGETTNRKLSLKVALCIGRVVGRSYDRRIAMVIDARDSAEILRSALAARIMASGSDIVNLGLLPTPVLQYYVRSYGDVTGGVIITASHNPPEHNRFVH